MRNEFEIQLPFFCGFYESPLYNSDTLYQETYDEDNMNYYKERFEDETLTADDLDIDFQEYEKACCEAFCTEFYNSSPNIIKSLDFVEMTSPNYYNFETDKVYAKVVLEDDWREQVKSFMETNKEWLTKRIRQEWSSRDGFWSYLSNDYNDWCELLQEDDTDERYLSEIIKYMMFLENNDIREDLIYGVLDSVYVGEYIINSKTIDNEAA